MRTFNTETTFADPVYNHPEPVEQMNKLNQCSGNILLGDLCHWGKAQRITKIAFLIIVREKRIFVHWIYISYHRIYEKLWFSTGEWPPPIQQEFMNGDHGICIRLPTVFQVFENKSDQVF